MALPMVLSSPRPRAYARAQRYGQENPEGTIETMMKYSREWGVETLEIAKEAYAECSPYWNVRVDAAGIQEAMAELSGKTGKPPVSVEQFLETRFLQEALGS